MTPPTMRRYVLDQPGEYASFVYETEAPVPELRGPTDIRINIKAISLNARDVQIATGKYPAQAVKGGLVPVSDGCGVVDAVGADVTLFKVGDRVCPVFPPGYYYEEDMPLHALQRGLGGGTDGVAADYIVCSQSDAIRIPSHFTFAEGATLPIAFATAWSSLYTHHPRLAPGNTVLCLGTGGVSLCAAQLALAGGAKVILTSSSMAKLERAREYLAPLVTPHSAKDTLQTVDYSLVHDWDREVRRLTHGRGVDFVIEIGGRGTLGRSIRSTRAGGLVAVSGYMSTMKRIPREVLEEDLAQAILLSAACVRGVFACNREEMKMMVSALEARAVRPIIGKTFPFSELKKAYDFLEGGKHMGKVVVEL